MTASAAGFTGFTTLLPATEDKFWLIHKFGKHVSHRYCEGDKYQYFLK